MRPGVLAASATCCMAVLGISALEAGEVVYLETGAQWKYLPGTAEASDPPSAWRQRDFDDTSWPAGPAPLGYGESEVRTNFSTFDPPMRGNYTSIFLRRSVEVSDPSRVVLLRLQINYDDGFALWINGTELIRQNVEGNLGDPLPFDETASRSHESGSYEDFDFSDPASILVPGRNVIAAQVFNSSRTSSDVFFDLRAVDPFGPDLVAPTVKSIIPSEGSTIRSLTEIEITFSEVVVNVDASDLLLSGSPAEEVRGLGKGPYRFLFPPVGAGPVTVSWAAGHGIADLADPPNLFEGGSWTYTVDPDLPIPDVTVTEIMASNRNGITDADDDAPDWFELHNRGDSPADIGACSVTDNKLRPKKWVFPPVVIPPGGYLLVFASGKDRRDPGSQLHTNFRLSMEGEYFGLFMWGVSEPIFEFPAPGPEEESAYPEQRPDISYGLTDAGTWAYFKEPTPGQPNPSGPYFGGFVADPVFDPPHGLFNDTEGFPVSISSATPGAHIYYTLDGSEPSPSQGTLYARPLTAEGSPQRPAFTIRAVAVYPDLLPSQVVTATYVFLPEVPTQNQHPEVWPPTWRNHPAADYEMDPQIVSKPQYREDLPAGLLELPSVSIVTDIDHLTGSSGIYVNPTGEGPSWERPASLELIYPEGRGIQVNCGLRIQGGASRQPNKSPKHSFRVLFKGEYGPGRLRWPLFPDSSVSSFDTLIFRANFNNSWIHWNGGQRSRAQHIRDQWARDTQIAMGQVGSHGLFVHLYLNGLYWGMYNLVERPSRAFSASYFGGDKDDYGVLNSGQVKEVSGESALLAQTNAAWSEVKRRALANLAVKENYEKLSEMLDLTALVDYMIINFYGANQDWPSHNWYATARLNPPGLWRFFCWDSERILESPTSNLTGVSQDNCPAYFYARLRVNPAFKLLFADRVHRHFFNGGALTPESARARWQARAQQVHNPAVAESARWGDYRRDVHSWRDGPYQLYERDNQLIREEQRLLTQYFPQRSQIMINQFRSAGLYPRIEAPEFNKHGGEIQEGFQLTITVPGGTTGRIYYTTDGEDPCAYNYQSAQFEPTASAHIYEGPITLHETTLVKARHQEGSTWSALTEATFTVPQPYEDLRLTEIMYHPADTGPLSPKEYEFLELKNTADGSMDLTGFRITGGITFVFPEGTVLRSGAFLVVVSNLAAFRQKYPEVKPFGEFQGYLSNGGDLIEFRDPDGEILWSVHYSDLPPWPESADGWGYSLVPLTAEAGGDPNDPASWRISTFVEGSPGADDTPTQSFPPRVLVEPEDQTVIAGQGVTFAVQATGLPAPAYQWQRDGTDIPGETGTSLTLPQVTEEDDGARFRCRLENEAGVVFSREALLSVLPPEAPVITAEPEDVTVVEEERAQFSCRATGKPEPSYQWQKNGELIPGATQQHYTIESVSLADDGSRFSCIVTNIAGSASTREATLTVLPRPKAFVRLDTNADGGVDISDAIYLLEVLFTEAPISCWDAGDANDDGAVNIADPIALLSYLFAVGFRPPPPFPRCDLDPTEDPLDCASFAPCEQ